MGEVIPSRNGDVVNVRGESLTTHMTEMKLLKTVAFTAATLIVCAGNEIPANANQKQATQEQIEFNQKWWKAVNEYNTSD